MNEKMRELLDKAEKVLQDKFRNYDRISSINTEKVLKAFADNRVSESHFYGTTGYGYDDIGRDNLDKIYAQVFECESAFVRSSIVNGTHALTIALFGLLRPNDIMLSVTGKPYDTLDGVIGITESKDNQGSLADYKVEYRQVDLDENSTVDLDKVKTEIERAGKRLKMVFIQRSKGYMNRETLSPMEIGKICDFVHSMSNAYVVVDNCYGEFVCEHEPTYYGADIIVGSLIKNPGGGMAQSGGYIAGKSRPVELCSYRLTCPGIGLECGATLGENKNIYKGLFYAPHTVAQALKTATLAAYLFEAQGYEVIPSYKAERYDIIQAVKLLSPQKLCAFCRGIQSGSPIDSFVTPEPWAMPGYSDEVIMAAGAFTQGSSIELSADGPLREPFTAFFQGGLTYESGKIGIMNALDEVLECK